MNNKLQIKIGDRFTYYGDIFEICFIDQHQIRYADINGGQMYFITPDDFLNKIISGDYKYDQYYLPSLHKNVKVSTHEIHHYLNHVICNEIPCSKPKLEVAIQQVIALHPNFQQISPSTLARYLKKYRDNSNNYNSLHSKRGGNNSLRFPLFIENIINEAIFEFINKREKFNAKDIHLIIKHRILQIEKYPRIPNLRTIYRRLERLDPYIITSLKKGKRYANKLYKAAGQSIYSPGAMAIVLADTHVIDCLIVDKNGYILGRPSLCIILDIYTRVIVGYRLCMLPQSSTKTLLALKNMLLRPHNNLPGGIPVRLIPDNGPEFQNNAIANFCHSFSITKCESKSYDPNDKAHLERFFKTLNDNFTHKLPGTTFSNPYQRGDYDSKKFACLTLDQMQEFIGEWIDNIYNCTIHSETLERPLSKWKESTSLIPALKIPKLEIEQKCRTVLRLTINKGQIIVKGLRYKSHALATLQYKIEGKVNIYVDQLDLCYIYVQDPFDSSNFIKADSVFPQLTKDLSLTEWIESRKILREKYKTDPTEIKNEQLLYLARLNFLEKIQSLKSVSGKFKQIKNDLPALIHKAEQELNIYPIKKNEVFTLTDSNEAKYEDLDASVNEKSLTEYFFEEINFNE
ncbi:transposase [Acinetobacter sp.]|uniref:transposase n=1 Tax=Acinetobacter sp. TaxID=472 RepID=UPI0031CF30FB